jgi:putative sterol carrier protein
MALSFPSEEWVQELMQVVNGSQTYKDAAQKWEGDLVFVIQPGPGLAEEEYLYLDLWHGECRSAKRLQTAGEEQAAFEIAAPLATWRDVLEGRLDPIRGITSRKLKLKGNLMKILKAPKAAVELVNCAREIDTAWPA